MHTLTTNEQERLAFAEGYTETAAMLARLDDAHHALGDEVAMQIEIDELKTERDGLKDELDNLFTDYKNARDLVDEERDAAQQLRAALGTVETMTTDKALRAYIREVLTS
jgi:FtsZ-binding cell division protein ZapB